jgi:hypothetical protein
LAIRAHGNAARGDKSDEGLPARRSSVDHQNRLRAGVRTAHAGLDGRGPIVVQRSQSAALKQVVESDMRENMEIQTLSKRISNINGELYTVLTHKAGNIEVEKNDARMAAILVETDALKKDLTVLKGKLPASERPRSTP